ncbi:TPA: hypothetical protein ACRZFV_005494, partial [Escherichia coli]
GVGGEPVEPRHTCGHAGDAPPRGDGPVAGDGEPRDDGEDDRDPHADAPGAVDEVRHLGLDSPPAEDEVSEWLEYLVSRD